MDGSPGRGLNAAGSKVNNTEFLRMSEESFFFDYWNSTAERAKGKTCKKAGGECMLKKTVKKKCNGIVDKTAKCDKKNSICCISDRTITTPATCPVVTCKPCQNKSTTTCAPCPTTAITTEGITTEGPMGRNITKKLDYIIERQGAIGSNITENLDYILERQGGMESSINNLSIEVQSVKASQGITELKLDIIIDLLTSRCPDGFISKGSKQCFKYYNDKKRSWDDANTKCKEEGLVLAQPDDAVAVALRKYLLDTYGDAFSVWLDARGDGAKVMWQRAQLELRSDNPLWYPGYPGNYIGTNQCLSMFVDESSWMSHPERPYHSWSVCSRAQYMLCEVLVR